MKKFIFMIYSLTLALSVAAQSKDEASVASAVEKLHTAMINANRTELDAITLEFLSYGHSSGFVEGKSEFIEKIVSGKSDFVSMEISEQKIHIQGKTAIVRHILNAKTNDNGKPGDVKIKILQVWQKEGKSWKLLARQAVKFT